jgi:uncharacterized protein (DUF1697 family)
MAELVEMVSGLGFQRVRSYIQSGNLVFEADDAGPLEPALRARFGVRVVVRSAAEMAGVLERNPFGPEHTHVVFLDRDPAPAALEPDRSPGDAFVVSGREVYLNCPNGLARCKLSIDWFERKLKVQATCRNWNTVLKLADMAGRG